MHINAYTSQQQALREHKYALEKLAKFKLKALKWN
jgi:hypothetical protein